MTDVRSWRCLYVLLWRSRFTSDRKSASWQSNSAEPCSAGQAGRPSLREPFTPYELSKTYEPGAIEACWAEYWVGEKLFHGGWAENPTLPAKDADKMGHSSSGG